MWLPSDLLARVSGDQGNLPFKERNGFGHVLTISLYLETFFAVRKLASGLRHAACPLSLLAQG